jgi:hypothetical protein
MAKKVKGFEDFNIEGEKEKLQKIRRSFKPNSDEQQFTTNTRNGFDETTRKITAVTKDEVDDKLKSLEETNEGIFSDRLQQDNDDFYEPNKISKMYSEEEVLELLVKMNEWPTTFDGEDEVREWFEEFKK